tara:strand:- start:2485 stop:3717 length:1233 start_codon:yes stop_codon:yes gene_type:complete
MAGTKIDVLRRFTPDGIDEFEQMVDAARRGESVNPASLIHNEEYTKLIKLGVDFETQHFSSRLLVAKYLDQIVNLAFDSNEDPLYDGGFWTWLTACFFDELTQDGKGKHKVYENAKYIFTPSGEAAYQDRHRHFLAGPWFIYDLYRDDLEKAQLVLCGKVTVLGDFVEIICSSQQILGNPSVMGAIHELYYDQQKGQPKFGAASQKVDSGSIRMYPRVQKQLMRTHYFSDLSPNRILELLPEEFDRWKKSKKSPKVAITDESIKERDQAKKTSHKLLTPTDFSGLKGYGKGNASALQIKKSQVGEDLFFPPLSKQKLNPERFFSSYSEELNENIEFRYTYRNNKFFPSSSDPNRNGTRDEYRVTKGSVSISKFLQLLNAEPGDSLVFSGDFDGESSVSLVRSGTPDLLEE